MEHPITPPPELLQQWAVEYWSSPSKPISASEKHIAIQAARWGADQELEACEEFLHAERVPGYACQLRATRRPKPPSLKQQALDQIAALERHGALAANTDVIRRALEALPDPQD